MTRPRFIPRRVQLHYTRQTHKYMRYILQERAREHEKCGTAAVSAGDAHGCRVRGRKKNKKKVTGSVLTAGAAVSLLLPLLFAASLATAADLELLLLLLG